MPAVTDYHEFTLTKAEIEERKTMLLDELDKNDQLNADLAQITAKQKGVIKSSDGRITKLRNAIKDCKEMIQCEILFNDPSDGKKTLIREDNEKKVVLDMTEDEIDQFAQKEMFEEN